MSEETAGAILSDAGITILIGLVVVFSVLLLLTGVFKLFGTAVSAMNGKLAVTAPAVPPIAPVAAPAPTVAAAASVPSGGNTCPVSSTPTVQNGIPEETVVAISAAIAAVAPAGTQYAVKEIRKV